MMVIDPANTKPLYWTLRTNILDLDGRPIVAAIQNQDVLDKEYGLGFRLTEHPDYPYSSPHKKLMFGLNSDWDLPDNFSNDASLLLFSERLLTLIDQTDIIYEKFEVQMVDKESRQPVSQKYFVFRMTDTMHAIDEAKSNPDKKSYLPRIILNESIKTSGKMMFRPKLKPGMIFIHNDLKQCFLENNITGFTFGRIEDFVALQERRKRVYISKGKLP